MVQPRVGRFAGGCGVLGLKRLVRRTIPVLCVLVGAIPVWSAPPLDQNTVTIVSATDQPWSVNVDERSQREMSLFAYCVKLEQVGGKSDKLEVIALYDPDSGLFWWRYQGVADFHDCPAIDRFKERHSVYVDDEQIVGFRALTPVPSIWIWESTSQYKSAESAKGAMLRTLREKGRDLIYGQASWVRQLKLAAHIGLDFAKDERTMYGALAVKIDSVSRVGNTWQVSLLRYDGRVATLALDDDFRVTNVSFSGEEPVPTPDTPAKRQ